MSGWYVCVGSNGFWTCEGDLNEAIDLANRQALELVKQRVTRPRIYHIYITGAIINGNFFEQKKEFLAKNLNEEGIYELYPFLRQNLGKNKAIVLNYVFHVDKDRNVTVKLKIEYGENKIEEREWVTKL